MLIAEYRKTLSNMMHLVGCKTEPPTLEALKKSMSERETYGMVAAITILPIILIDKSEARGLDEIFDENGEVNTSAAHSGKIFREVMSKRFPKWYNKGLMD